MTPKEEAVELVDKFYQTTPNEAWYNPPLGSLSMEYKAWEQAKQCAHITVIKLLEYSKAHGFIGLTEHYEQVKIEIENL